MLWRSASESGQKYAIINYPSQGTPNLQVIHGPSRKPWQFGADSFLPRCEQRQVLWPQNCRTIHFVTFCSSMIRDCATECLCARTLSSRYSNSLPERKRSTRVLQLTNCCSVRVGELSQFSDLFQHILSSWRTTVWSKTLKAAQKESAVLPSFCPVQSYQQKDYPRKRTLFHVRLVSLSIYVEFLQRRHFETACINGSEHLIEGPAHGGFAFTCLQLMAQPNSTLAKREWWTACLIGTTLCEAPGASVQADVSLAQEVFFSTGNYVSKVKQNVRVERNTSSFPLADSNHHVDLSFRPRGSLQDKP